MTDKQHFSEEITLSMGPQHPSTHGVLRLILRLDGEYVVAAKPDIGYLHRGMEKMAEDRTFIQFIPLTDRFDYLSGMFNNYVYVRAVETVAGIEVPERADFIRVIAMELNRLASHLVFWGAFGLDVGALTPILYAFRERDKVLDLLESLSGARMTFNYMRFGGVRGDLPPGFVEKCRTLMDEMNDRVDEYNQLLSGNEIFHLRTKDIAILTAETAIAMGVSGPMLRASGLAADLRKTEPYSVYDRFDFDIPTRTNGDCFDRYMIRMDEMRQSVRIIRQALDKLPEGPVQSKVSKVLKPAAGDAYVRIESPRGEIGVYLVCDGGNKPYRFHLRAPSFCNLFAMEQMCIGNKIGDLVVILGSVDIVLGDIDR